jgi:hypothetical protein
VWKLYGDALVAFADGRRGASDAAVAQLAADYGSKRPTRLPESTFRGERDLTLNGRNGPIASATVA